MNIKEVDMELNEIRLNTIKKINMERNRVNETLDKIEKELCNELKEFKESFKGNNTIN